MSLGLLVLLVLVGGGIALLGIAALILSAAARARRYGRIRGVDLPGRPGERLSSERYRLSGRPDEIVEGRDGTWIPVELKTRAAPSRGPPESHRAQVAAYCLLIEETTGRSPPFGLLRYGDGREFRVPWDGETRRWVVEVRAALDRPYAGEDRASPARCRRCSFREVCDRRAA